MQIINDIKSNAVDIDGLSIKLIRLYCPTTLEFLTHIVNFSVEQAGFPNKRKQLRVVPLSKCNSPSSYGDLRPVSILSCLS